MEKQTREVYWYYTRACKGGFYMPLYKTRGSNLTPEDVTSNINSLQGGRSAVTSPLLPCTSTPTPSLRQLLKKLSRI
jgi:hypothetical protein